MNARASRAVSGPRRAGILAAAALFTGALAGCEPSEPPPPVPAEQAAVYLPPPAVTRVSAEGGELVITGEARPGERVRLLDPAGSAYGATADAQGVFAIRVPAAGPALFGVAAQRPGQAQPAEGWLYVPPGAPEAAVLLRPGAAARSIAGEEPLTTVDYDAGGGVALAGRAEPGATVRVLMDGALMGETRADATGRYAIRLAASAPPGPHDLQVNTGGVRHVRQLDLRVGAPDGVVQSTPFEGGWRVAWRPPGGGVQVTHVLASADD